VAKNVVVDSLYPADYALVWEAWNQHFHDGIVRALAQAKPRLALVLVGLEHSYWLRRELARCPDVELVNAEACLRELA
jgi:hypothetical protein